MCWNTGVAFVWSKFYGGTTNEYLTGVNKKENEQAAKLDKQWGPTTKIARSLR